VIVLAGLAGRCSARADACLSRGRGELLAGLVWRIRLRLAQPDQPTTGVSSPHVGFADV